MFSFWVLSLADSADCIGEIVLRDGFSTYAKVGIHIVDSPSVLDFAHVVNHECLGSCGGFEVFDEGMSSVDGLKVRELEIRLVFLGF